MIPVTNTEIEMNPIHDITADYNTFTYNVHYNLDDPDAFVSGYTDNKDALAQAIYRMLNTERYEFPIYSENYGITINELYGQPMGLVECELTRKIRDCLMTDDRVTNVDNFSFERKGHSLLVNFTVFSNTMGDVTFTKEVVL